MLSLHKHAQVAKKLTKRLRVAETFEERLRRAETENEVLRKQLEIETRAKEVMRTISDGQEEEMRRMDRAHVENERLIAEMRRGLTTCAERDEVWAERFRVIRRQYEILRQHLVQRARSSSHARGGGGGTSSKRQTYVSPALRSRDDDDDAYGISPRRLHRDARQGHDGSDEYDRPRGAPDVSAGNGLGRRDLDGRGVAFRSASSVTSRTAVVHGTHARVQDSNARKEHEGDCEHRTS